MELKEPKRKGHAKPPQKHFLPIPLENETEFSDHSSPWKRYTGIFLGDSVAVYNPDHMIELYKKGFFGKGSLSRSEPCFERVQHGVPPVIRERQWLRRCDWEKKADDYQSSSEVLTQMSLLNNLPNSNKKGSNSLVSGNTRNLHKKKKSNKIVELVNLDSDNSISDKEESKESCSKTNEIKVTKLSEAVSHTTNKIPAQHELVILDSPSVLTIDPDEDLEVVDKERETQPDHVQQLNIHVSSDKDTSQKSQDKHENKIVNIEESEHDSVQEDSANKCSIDNSNMQQSMNEVTSTEQENLSDEQTSVAKITESSPTDNTVQQEKDTDTNKESAIVNTENLYSQEELTKQSRIETVTDDELCITKSTSSETKQSQIETVTDDELCITKSTSSDMNCFKTVKKNLIVVADSGSEDENEYFNKLNPRLETKNQVQESLNLTLEEAFFLSFGLGRLQVLDLLGNPISLKNSWKSFVLSKPDFIQNYISYHHFRSKGWVVKPGLKFGGDFLLYKDGPPFYHASYIVMVDVLNEKNGCRIKGISKEPLTSYDLVNLNRLAETSGKEVLFCYVLWPEDLHDKSTVTPKMFRRFKVSEVLLRRWKSSEKREQLDQDEIEPV